MNEKEGYEIMIENLMAKVKDFKHKINLREGDNYCTFCEKKFENHFDTKVHVKDEHFICQGTQCDVPETDQQPTFKESLVKEFVGSSALHVSISCLDQPSVSLQHVPNQFYKK